MFEKPEPGLYEDHELTKTVNAAIADGSTSEQRRDAFIMALQAPQDHQVVSWVVQKLSAAKAPATKTTATPAK